MNPRRKNVVEPANAPLDLDSRLLGELDHGFDCAADQAAGALRSSAPDADVAQRFEAAVEAVLTAAAAQPDLTRLCLIEAPGLGTKALARKDVGLQRFVDLLDGELARGGGQAPPLVSEMVVGGIYEVVQRAVRAGDISALPDLAGQLRQLWLPALRDR